MYKHLRLNWPLQETIIHTLNYLLAVLFFFKKRQFLKAFARQICDKKFSEKSNLNRHVYTVHEKKESFVCQLCDKIFTRKDNLKQHIETHGEIDLIIRSFDCTLCAKNLCHLKQHVEAIQEKKKRLASQFCDDK